MSLSKRTKKNISHNPVVIQQKKNKKIISNNEDKAFIKGLLTKNSQNKSKVINDSRNTELRNKSYQRNTNLKGKMSKKNKIINNFHRAVSSTNSDDVIMKMLQLKENDIINFYSNLENMIGKDLTENIKTQMNIDIQNNKKNKIVLCPFCRESQANCVILLCGHLLCTKCAQNINRCKYPCPKCKKPIKYIQYIIE